MMNLTETERRILEQVPMTYTLRWQKDIIGNLAGRGLVKIERQLTYWRLTDAGRKALAEVTR